MIYSLEERIREYLDDGKTATITDIVNALSSSRSGTWVILQRLVKDRQLEKKAVRKDTYTLHYYRVPRRVVTPGLTVHNDPNRKPIPNQGGQGAISTIGGIKSSGDIV